MLLRGSENWHTEGNFLLRFEVKTTSSLQLLHDAYWLQADTILTASATRNCSARLCWVNSSSLEVYYLEKQDMGKLSSHSGST